MGNKKINFAGSTVGEPWWTAGEIVAKVLEPHGYTVEVQAEAGGQENPRWITSRKAEIGATTQGMLINALAGNKPYEGEVHKDFTSIATFGRKNYLALAIRAGTGLRDLYDVKKKQYPLRILAGGGGEEGSVLDTVLRHHGTNLEEIKEWGGKLYTWSGYLITEHMFDRAPVHVREFDMMLGNTYLGYTPHNRYWYDATVLQDMRFLDFDEELIEKLLLREGNKRMTIPRRLYPGIDRDIPTVGIDKLYIYCLKDQPAELVRLIAEGLDTNSDIFRSVHVAFYYDREMVWKSEYIPLHPAAEEYYRSKGYMK
jgi:TRAP-type uncharacterized transport system substrate-binding protein